MKHELIITRDAGGSYGWKWVNYKAERQPEFRTLKRALACFGTDNIDTDSSIRGWMRRWEHVQELDEVHATLLFGADTDSIGYATVPDGTYVIYIPAYDSKSDYD